MLFTEFLLTLASEKNFRKLKIYKHVTAIFISSPRIENVLRYLAELKYLHTKKKNASESLQYDMVCKGCGIWSF